MNSGIIIVGVVLVALCTVPFVLMGMKHRKKTNWFLKQLRELASKQQAEITQYDFCRDFILGIDEKKHQLFYFQFRDQTETVHHVKLGEIAVCKLINNSRTLDNVTVVDQLVLNFKPAAKNKEEFSWNIYNSNIHTQLDDELQLMTKWVALIKKHIA
jgi:hypothetical protein